MGGCFVIHIFDVIILRDGVGYLITRIIIYNHIVCVNVFLCVHGGYSSKNEGSRRAVLFCSFLAESLEELIGKGNLPGIYPELVIDVR